MNTKRKGTRNEHRSMALLEAAGYRCTRSAASLGEWDIVGIGTTDIVLVQVRTRDWPSLLERAALAEFQAPPNARKLLHRWKPRGRWPDQQEL
jgi:Holliday junction resolvase-like predicted endonuclease